MNLEKRATEEEIMDDLEVSGPVIAQTLRELDVINRTLGGNKISLSAFRKILKKRDVHSVADLGCGGADILIAMARIAERKGQSIKFSGIDANPHIVAYAQEHTIRWPNISIHCQNIFSPDFARQPFDIVHCCLFLHHFTDEELIGLFRGFHQQTRVAVIVNDLHRHFLAYHSIRLITRFFSKSYMVKNDAALSVARGFSRRELQSILARAGISNYSLRWRWAFRWELVIPTT